jgi:hypothetical protein
MSSPRETPDWDFVKAIMAYGDYYKMPVEQTKRNFAAAAVFV